jgi:peptidoglycan hydrolase-like amidase
MVYTPTMKSYGARHRRRDPHQMIDSRGVRRPIGFLVAVIAIAIAIGFVFLPAPFASAGNFVFYGRGNGHGVGLSQWGAWGGARAGYTYAEIVAFYYRGTTLQTVSPSQEILTVRISSNTYDTSTNPTFTTVDLKPTVSTATLRKYTASAVFTTEDVAVGVLVHTVCSATAVRATVGGGIEQGPYAKVELVPGGTGDSEGRVNIVSPVRRAGSGPVEGELWGTVRVRPASATSLLIENLVQVDHYAAGVGEVISDWARPDMPAWYALEAVKAEAVAARSRAVADQGVGLTLNDNGVDICYRGYTFEHTYPGLTQAAEETAGEILTYGGKAIWADASAHSGGYTTAAGYSLPYLVAQPDPWSLEAPPTHPAYPGPGWPWSYTISQTTLSGWVNGLLKDVNGHYVNVGTLLSITIASHEKISDPASRPLTLYLVGSAGTATVKMSDFRSRVNKAAGVTRMPSTLVYNIVSAAATTTPCTTIRGTDRFDTAILVSQAAFPGPLPPGSGVVLAPGWESYQEALCGAPLAAAYGGPVLLSSLTGLYGNVEAELLRLAPDYVFCIGLSSAVADAVKAKLPGATVTPINGTDVYDMSHKVAKALRDKVGDLTRATAIVTVGYNFPDALGVSPLACANLWPVILTDSGKGGALHPSATATITDLGVTKALKVGTYATLPAEVEGVGNLSGVDRYRTNANVAVWAKAYAGLTYDHLGIATGDKFPDALVAGPFLALDHGILLLSPLYGPLPASIAAEISANAASVDKVTFMAMIEPVKSQVQALLP